MTTFSCPKDPVHLIRIEFLHHGPVGRTAFCLMCMKHYPLCGAVQYMHSCELERNHIGEHLGANGSRWIDDAKRLQEP